MCNIGKMALMKSGRLPVSMTLRSSEIWSRGQLTAFEFKGFFPNGTKLGNGASLSVSKQPMMTQPRPGLSPSSWQPRCAWPSCCSAAPPCCGACTRGPSTSSPPGTVCLSIWKSFWVTLITIPFCFSPSRPLMRMKSLTNWVSLRKSPKAADRAPATAVLPGPRLGRDPPSWSPRREQTHRGAAPPCFSRLPLRVTRAGHPLSKPQIQNSQIPGRLNNHRARF